MISESEIMSKLDGYGVTFNNNKPQYPYSDAINKIDWNVAMSMCDDTYDLIQKAENIPCIIGMKGINTTSKISISGGKICGTSVPIREISDKTMKIALMYAYILGKSEKSFMNMIHDLVG